jgi:hypothetical protein
MTGESDEGDARIAAAAARARTAMAAGATLDDVLRMFRSQFGSVQSILALRKIAAMDLRCLMRIVFNDERRSYAHLTLADLELLSDAPSGMGRRTLSNRHSAIMEGNPYLLYVRNRETTEYVYIYTSTMPLEAPPSAGRGISGGTFESLCDDVRRSAAACPAEVRILRDEPDQLLLHFLRARLAS